MLLLELFPLVAKTYLTEQKKKAYAAGEIKDAPKPAENKAAEAPKSERKQQAITGKTIVAPLPGRVIDIKVKVGDEVKPDQEVMVLEAMKMENSITSSYKGKVKQILVGVGDNVATDAVLIEVE